MSADVARASSTKPGALRAVVGRTIYARLLSSIRGLVVLPLINQAELGIFRYVSTLQSYTLFFGLGGTTTLGVEYPERDAADDREACDHLMAMAYWLSLFGAAMATVYLVVALTQAGIEVLWMRLLLAVLGGISVVANFVSVALRVQGKFERLARNDAIADTLSFVATLAGAYWGGLRGLMIATLTSSVVGMVLGADQLRPSVLRRTSFVFLKNKLLPSVRLLTSAAINRLVVTADLIVLAAVVKPGDPRLGTYALGTMAAAIVIMMINAISQVQAVELLRAHGRNAAAGGADTRRLLEELLVRDTLVSLVLASAIVVLGPVAIHLVARQHAAAIPYLGIFALAAIIVRWRDYPTSILLVKGETRRSNAVSLAALVIVVVAMLCNALAEGPLVGFALAPLVGYTFAGVVSIAQSARALDDRSTAGFVTRLVVSLVPFALGSAAPFFVTGLPLLVAISAAAAVASGFLMYLFLREGVVSALRTWRIGGRARK